MQDLTTVSIADSDPVRVSPPGFGAPLPDDFPATWRVGGNQYPARKACEEARQWGERLCRAHIEPEIRRRSGCKVVCVIVARRIPAAREAFDRNPQARGD